MTQKSLDAILTRHNKKVQIALRHVPCNTVIKIKVFDEQLPFFHMQQWIKEREESVEFWHFCEAIPHSLVESRG